MHGSHWTKYGLSVMNSSEYPDELFEVAADLPPCGLNTNASRSWVDIYNHAGKRLYGFCAIKSSQELKKLWFSLPGTQVPDDSIYIVIKDRRLNKEFRSNLVSVNVP